MRSPFSTKPVLHLPDLYEALPALAWPLLAPEASIALPAGVKRSSKNQYAIEIPPFGPPLSHLALLR